MFCKNCKIKSLYKLCTLIVTLATLVCMAGCSGGPFNETTDSKYISAAQIVLRDSLKNPSSAIFNDGYIYEKDDYGRAIVYLDVTAENSFGGAERERYYVCITGIEGDNFTYSKTANYVSADNGTFALSTLKNMNNFGEPK